MNFKHRLLTLVALAASSLAVFGGDITGKVTLKGEPSGELKLPLDPLCKKTVKPGVTPTTRFYVKDASGGLADVFVYLKNVDATKAPEEAVVLDQKSCEYSPYVIGAQVGQTIKVLNSDPVLHNVHPTPKKAGKEYNKAQLPNGPALTFSWDKPEVFLRFKCDVHPWMVSQQKLRKIALQQEGKKERAVLQLPRWHRLHCLQPRHRRSPHQE